MVTGVVTIGGDSRVLHGAVLNSDLGPVVIGSYVLVMEQALLRGRASHPLTIGDAVMVGPHTHLDGHHRRGRGVRRQCEAFGPGSTAGPEASAGA